MLDSIDAQYKLNYQTRPVNPRLLLRPKYGYTIVTLNYSVNVMFERILLTLFYHRTM